MVAGGNDIFRKINCVGKCKRPPPPIQIFSDLSSHERDLVKFDPRSVAHAPGTSGPVAAPLQGVVAL
jgi:hypothetical protein